MTADHETVLCLRDLIRDALMVRRDEVITPELALERANNTATAIAAEFNVAIDEDVTEPMGHPGAERFSKQKGTR